MQASNSWFALVGLVTMLACARPPARIDAGRTPAVDSAAAGIERDLERGDVVRV